MQNQFKNIKLVVFLVFFIIGIIFSRHYMISKADTEKIDIAQYNQMQEELKALETERENLDQEYQKLSDKLDIFWSESLEEENVDTAILEEFELMKKLAGLTDVSGEGIIVSINDKENYDPLKDQLASLIHDGNIKYVVDLFINNGAQAVSVNDLRIVNSSYIFCVGTTILCNNQRMTPPYIIKAIGPVEQMLNAVEKDAVLTKLRNEPFFIRLQAAQTDHLIIHGYETPTKIQEDINLLLPAGGK